MKRLDLAAERVVEDLATRAQLLLKAKSADAGPAPVPADAAAPSGAKKPTTLEEARESALARVDKLMGTGGVGT